MITYQEHDKYDACFTATWVMWETTANYLKAYSRIITYVQITDCIRRRGVVVEGNWPIIHPIETQ